MYSKPLAIAYRTIMSESPGHSDLYKSITIENSHTISYYTATGLFDMTVHSYGMISKFHLASKLHGIIGCDILYHCNVTITVFAAYSYLCHL